MQNTIHQDSMDLTDTLLRAKEIYHSPHEIGIACDRFESAGYRLDWDVDDGEEWGSIVNSKQRVAMFHAKLALYFVDAGHFKAATNIIRHSYSILPVVVEVVDWDAAQYSADFEKLQGTLDWRSCLSSEKFSINDLWYATI